VPAGSDFTGEPGEAMPRGFRWWRVSPSGDIYSAWFDVAWNPTSNEATCGLPVSRLGRRAWAKRHSGGVPAQDCSCGFYALHTMPAQPGDEPDPDRPWLLDPDDWSGKGASVVFGVSEAWGRVLIGTQGWRARYSRAIALYVPSGSELWESDRLRRVGERYGIPVTNTLDALEEWSPEPVVVIPEAEPEPERLPPVLNLVTGAAGVAAGGGMIGDGPFVSDALRGGSAGPVPARWPGTGPPFGSRASALDLAGRTDRQVAAIERLAGPGPKRILELGAGAGLRASPLAERGHSVIAVAGGFADLDLPGPFDVVIYGGFGVGSEDDQHRTLQDLSRRVDVGGCVLIEVMTPWAWAAVREQGRGLPPAEHRAVVFDAETSRVRLPFATMWGEAAQSEALRCYGPADLRFLLQGTGLGLESFEAFAGPGYETVPRLEAATFYLARLTVGA
jgi:hypothetical protein